MPKGCKKLMKAWFSHAFKKAIQLLSGQSGAQGAALYFAHIPKTAGTSFIVLLDRFFATDKIFPHQLWREVSKIDTAENQAYRLFRGHFGGGGVKQLTARPIQPITILRSPETLATSTYEFVKREKNTKVHELVSANDMSLAAFLQHPQTAALVSDRMVRNLSFDFKEDPAAQEVFLSAETIAQLQPIINQQKSAISDEARLNRAKKFIESCAWFGLLERFDESLQWLSFVNRWPPFGLTQKLNRRKKQRQLSTEESQLIAEMNAFDSRLYDWASKRFDSQYQSMLNALERFRTEQDESVDELLDKHYRSHHAKAIKGSLPLGMAYGFDQPLLGSQWHRRELMQPENEYFRWTGPDAVASIDFWIEPADYELIIRVINATDVTVLNELKLTINNQPLHWHTADEGVVRVLRATVPMDAIATDGLARLGFHCGSMVSHQQAFGSDDERLVGVAVHRMEFKHVN